MTGFKKPSLVSRQSSYKSLYVNPLNEIRHNRSSSESDRSSNLGFRLCRNPVAICDKENAEPNIGSSLKEKRFQGSKQFSSTPLSQNRILKSSSLQLCIQLNEPDSTLGLALRNPLIAEKSKPANVWDYSDSESAPASSWSTLPNSYEAPESCSFGQKEIDLSTNASAPVGSLLCRPLPLDIGRCTCIIVKEASEGLNGTSLYSLYTNEGQGRQDRKLAVARHRRCNGRTEFIIAKNAKGILCSSDENFLGTITANLMGSRYSIWEQGKPYYSLKKQSKRLLAVVAFTPTVTTLTGSFRSMSAWIPKHQSMQLKNTAQIQHVNELPKDWEDKMNKAHQLVSKVPYYNSISKRYELDFRERGRTGLKIRSSVKNFQLVMEENERQPILQLGRVGKSNYLMDYRFPLTGYQAFSICLTSIDSKLCCSM